MPTKPKAPTPKASTAGPNGKQPTSFLYALKHWQVERRAHGWWVAEAIPTFAAVRPTWHGPFATIETACLAIARRLAAETADRHTRHIEHHRLKPADPLYGLKPTTRLAGNGKAKADSVA
ncbi:MAG: hypothetical protein R3D27_13990 [Hyphomicrobiaceae bacterium]